MFVKAGEWGARGRGVRENEGGGWMGEQGSAVWGTFFEVYFDDYFFSFLSSSPPYPKIFNE